LFGRFSKIHGLLAITLQTMSGMEEKTCSTSAH